MHAHNSALRQEVVHDREGALLGFAGVVCASNQNQPLTKVHHDERWRSCAIAWRVSLKTGEVDDRKLRLMRRCFTTVTNEHRASEKRMPGELTDHAYRQTVLWIGPDKSVLHKKFAA